MPSRQSSALYVFLRPIPPQVKKASESDEVTVVFERPDYDELAILVHLELARGRADPREFEELSPPAAIRSPL